MGLYDVDGYINARSWAEQYAPADTALPLTAEQVASIPDSFDLRAAGGASPVKDKGKTPEGIGICWLFSGIASLESHLLYKKVIDPADSFAILSELHGAYSTFDNSGGDKDYQNPRGRKPGVKPAGKPAYGGHRYMAVNYLTRDAGTTPHCIDPYYKDDMKQDILDQILPKRKWEITEGKPANFYVREIRYLPEPVPPGADSSFLLQVKYHVMTYGGVNCSIFWKDEYVKSLTGGEYSYYDNTSGGHSNHELTIMGWNDRYPGGNFKTSPKNPGAFLVKNCWATEPAGQYLWISYESANFGMDAYCVSDVKKDFYAHPYKIYQHEKYGYNDLVIPYAGNSEKTAGAKNVFTAVAGDSLAGVSFYACAACTVSLYCSVKADPLVQGYGCPLPGYYTCDLFPPIKLTPGSFEVIVVYTSITNLPAYVPLEVNDDANIYNHWQIDSGLSFVWENGAWKDVADIPDLPTNEQYGYYCMKAIIKNDSNDIQRQKLVYDTLPAPVIQDGYSKIFADTADGFTLEWRLEPYMASSYSRSISSPVIRYAVQSGGVTRYGLVNTGSAAADVYLCAAIKGANDRMRKVFKLNVGTVNKNYTFTCDAVAKGENTTTISGSFTVPGAVITAEANGQTGTTLVDNSGNWEIKDFRLYDEFEGWKEAYENTGVKIRIKSSDNLLLAQGEQTLKVELPADKTDDGWEVETFVGLVVGVALVAGVVGGAIVYLKCNIAVPAGATAGVGVLGAGGANVNLNGRRNRITVNGPAEPDRVPLLDRANNIHDTDVVYRRRPDPGTLPALSGAEHMGVLANKISKGGSVTNCHVTGSIGAVNNIGGLFFEGEDVTVKDCTVDLEIENCAGTYAGLAVNLAGSANQISGVTIKGSVKAGKVAGLVETMNGGSVKNAGVSLAAEAQSAVSGLLGSANGVALENAVVTGSYLASGGRAAGAVLSMNGGKIVNCRVSAVLAAASGAFGIAGAMQAGAVIEKCYSACRLTASAANAAVCGIAEGIQGSPGGISDCVVIGSHLSGAKPARVSLQAAVNCAAYDGMTCDTGVSFVSAGEVLKPAPAFFSRDLFQEREWDFTVWDIDADNLFPVIRDSGIPQHYDYSFPYPHPPADGKFVYSVNQVVAILGANHERMNRLDWILSPHLSSAVIDSGEFLAAGNSFYVQIAALPVAGDYDLSLICVLDEHRYNLPVLLEIKG
jgi:C1A family cysteine protease